MTKGVKGCAVFGRGVEEDGQSKLSVWLEEKKSHEETIVTVSKIDPGKLVKGEA